MLEKIEIEDPFLIQIKASLYYYYIVDNRDKLKEAVSFIKTSAQLTSYLLGKAPQNYHLANLVACLFIERGRMEDGVYVFS